MVQQQLCTLEHLRSSGFGRPPPHHGLQLLYWFARHCVTLEINNLNLVAVMVLVSDCHPERGCYGFHQFGNIELILPVLRRRRRQLAYYLVGNLNTETYPASANLPAYVTEYYRLGGYRVYRDYRGYNNLDRIIISYQEGTRVVETVYVTEHDMLVSGRFSHDRTHEISPDLIRVLQSPQLDLLTFLTNMGYYGGVQGTPDESIGWIHDQEHADEQLLDLVPSYSGYSGRTQQIDVNILPFNYDQPVVQYVSNPASAYNQYMAGYGTVQHDYMRYRAIMRPTASMHGSVWSAWEWTDPGSDDKGKKWEELGIAAVKMLLWIGAFYLAAKSLSWLRSSWKTDSYQDSFKMLYHKCFGMTPIRRPALPTHIMLDYVY